MFINIFFAFFLKVDGVVVGVVRFPWGLEVNFKKMSGFGGFFLERGGVGFGLVEAGGCRLLGIFW